MHDLLSKLFTKPVTMRLVVILTVDMALLVRLFVWDLVHAISKYVAKKRGPCTDRFPEINYQNIFRKLGELNYKGIVAMEFRPSGDPIMQHRAAREMALRAGREGLSKKA